MFDLTHLLIASAWAQDAATSTAPASSGSSSTSMLMNFAPLLLIFAVFYVLIIRPQQKKMDEQGKMIKALRRGDRVITTGGIHGKIVKLEGDDNLIVEIADGVQIKLVRTHVHGLAAKTDPTVANDAEDADKKVWHMIYLERWKVILIVAACVFGVLYALPNALGKSGAEWLQTHTPSFFPNQTVNLGLDLRGGSHLLLEVAIDTVIEERLQGLVDQTRGELRKAKIGYTDLGLINGGVHFKLTDPSQADAAKETIQDMDRDLSVSSSNGDFALRMTDAKIAERKRAAMDQSIEIVRRRIDETGTREPSIQREGDNRILVQLPGVDDPEHIKNLLGQTAKLTFRLVDETAAVNDAQVGHTPPGEEMLPSAEENGRPYIVQKRVMVSGDTLVDAQPSFQNGEPVVSFKFDSVGGRRFGEATRENTGHLFAIVLDNKIISAPVIREPILGGSGVISGHFTTQSAQDLALLLRAGALPAPIKILEERTVGPGLGADSIKAGATASLIGLGLVVVFFITAYGLLGVFGVIALMFNIALMFAILSILQATLTLPGIAGIVLTIATALDANVLVFERIREEQRLGRSPISAIDAGYSRALSAIIDANMTTLIAAILLYIFGSGPVKGFAVTLTIGIITSIFSAIMITRLIVIWWLRSTRPKVIPI